MFWNWSNCYYFQPGLRRRPSAFMPFLYRHYSLLGLKLIVIMTKLIIQSEAVMPLRANKPKGRRSVLTWTDRNHDVSPGGCQQSFFPTYLELCFWSSHLSYCEVLAVRCRFKVGFSVGPCPKSWQRYQYWTHNFRANRSVLRICCYIYVAFRMLVENLIKFSSFLSKRTNVCFTPHCLPLSFKRVLVATVE